MAPYSIALQLSARPRKFQGCRRNPWKGSWQVLGSRLRCLGTFGLGFFGASGLRWVRVETAEFSSVCVSGSMMSGLGLRASGLDSTCRLRCGSGTATGRLGSAERVGKTSCCLRGLGLVLAAICAPACQKRFCALHRFLNAYLHAEGVCCSCVPHCPSFWHPSFWPRAVSSRSS